VNTLLTTPLSKESSSAVAPFMDVKGINAINTRDLDLPSPISSSVVVVRLAPHDSEPLDTLLKIKQSQPAMDIIFIGGELDLHVLVDLFRRGLNDYLLEPIKQTDIGDAIQRIQLRKKVVKFDPRRYDLTKREIEVCGLLVQGLRSKDIAAYLQITPATIKVHKARVMKKLQVTSLPGLVRKAMTFNH
jgi:FixJ family two-component response regulator